jgi:hypothetical protein
MDQLTLHVGGAVQPSPRSVTVPGDELRPALTCPCS